MNRSPSIPADRGQFGRRADEPIQIKQEIRLQEPEDIYAELKKLKELLDAKIITQEEFDRRKKEDSRAIAAWRAGAKKAARLTDHNRA